MPTTIKRLRRKPEKDPTESTETKSSPSRFAKKNTTRKRNRTRQRNRLMDEGLNRLKLTQKISKEPN